MELMMTSLFLAASDMLKADDRGMCGDDATALYCEHEGTEFYNTVVISEGVLMHLGCSECDDHSDVYLKDKVPNQVGFRFRFAGDPEKMPVIALATQPGKWKDLF
jgi:hypothetical protein